MEFVVQHLIYFKIISHLETNMFSINKINSSCKPITIGVPQGSILGSLLFLMYINDLPNAILEKPRLFADDTCLIINEPSSTILKSTCNLELLNLSR